MSTLKKITAVVAIIVGVLFLFNGASDIQLGFGSVLLALGIFHL